MQYRIKRTVPYDGRYLRPGDAVPDDVPQVILQAWLRDDRAEPAKGKAKAGGDGG